MTNPNGNLLETVHRSWFLRVIQALMTSHGGATLTVPELIVIQYVEFLAFGRDITATCTTFKFDTLRGGG